VVIYSNLVHACIDLFYSGSISMVGRRSQNALTGFHTLVNRMAEYKFPGMMKKVINKKEIEDQRKRDDEVAAAKAFEEYIADFQETQGGAKALNKTWVKAGVYEAGKKRKERTCWTNSIKIQKVLMGIVSLLL